jgi:hypothetical protein
MIKYRDCYPTGETDMIFFLLIHQSKDMVDYMIQNIKKYVEGNYYIFIHFNGSNHIDENEYENNIWFCRNIQNTEKFTERLTKAISMTMYEAFQHIKSINIMTISSGSAFYKKYTIPSQKQIRFKRYYSHFSSEQVAIPFTYYGNTETYLLPIFQKNNKKLYIWWYPKIDSDSFLKKLIEKNNFEYYMGGQFSGMVIPYEAAYTLSNDIFEHFDEFINKDYPCEEFYFQTYATNYGILNNIDIGLSECIINWNNQYFVNNNSIQHYRNHHIEGHLVCKLSDDPHHGTRKFLNQ